MLEETASEAECKAGAKVLHLIIELMRRGSWTAGRDGRWWTGVGGKEVWTGGGAQVVVNRWWYTGGGAQEVVERRWCTEVVDR